LAGLWSIPGAYASVDEIDPGMFDAVVIALPIAAQSAIATWALSNHLHTFVEKPPASDLSGLRALAEQARCSGVICRVGMNFRWAEGVLTLLAKVDSGRFGQVSYARVVHIARKPVEPFTDELSFEASLFHAQGIHAIDLATLFMPDIVTVSGQMLAVQRGRLCILAGENSQAGHRFEATFGSCAAGFYHQLDIVTSTGDILQLRNLSELVHLPNGGDVDVDEYPGARVLWRRSPIGGGYATAGYAPELAAFRDLVGGRSTSRLATIADLLPVYEAFDDLLITRGLKWTA
ncbi:MAG TPA: Gfo/Idh/MocA family oxidoreductase, partial [Streptosporangiaceae bacterium]|nr:Gfo/Idh/MocA family oxidoreductase [Streptosporangiaceae bacterium]